MKEGSDLWWKPIIGDLILGKHGLRDQHVKQAAQSALQRDFARLAIFMGSHPPNLVSSCTSAQSRTYTEPIEKDCRRRLGDYHEN